MAITLDGSNGILSPDFEPSSSTTPTNGLFLPAANALGFATNSTERLRLDASGNLGLGATPSAWDSGYAILQAGSNGSAFGGRSAANTAYMMSNSVRSGSAWKYINTAATAQFQIENGAFYWFTAPSGTAGNAISFTQAMTLDASGYLGIGTTSPTAGIQLGSPGTNASGTSNTLRIYRGGVAGQYAEINDTGAEFILNSVNGGGGGIGFFGDGVRKLTIDSSGNFIVGATGVRPSLGASLNQGNGTNQWELFVGNTSSANTSFGIEVYSNAVSAYRFQVGMGGTIYATSTSITAISDISLKENIRPLETGLAEILKLQPRRFDWKNGDGTDVAGFIAQEVETVLPDLVSDYKYNEEETKRGLKMGDMIPTLVKAIQELTARLEALEAK